MSIRASPTTFRIEVFIFDRLFVLSALRFARTQTTSTNPGHLLRPGDRGQADTLRKNRVWPRFFRSEGIRVLATQRLCQKHIGSSSRKRTARLFNKSLTEKQSRRRLAQVFSPACSQFNEDSSPQIIARRAQRRRQQADLLRLLGNSPLPLWSFTRQRQPAQVAALQGNGRASSAPATKVKLRRLNFGGSHPTNFVPSHDS